MNRESTTEVCKDCGGQGTIPFLQPKEFRPKGPRIADCQCPTCKGTGIVGSTTERSGDASKKNRNLVWETIYHAAQAKGCLAAAKTGPAPMLVQQHENMMDDSSPVAKQWLVPGGVCGFAWVVVRPGTSSFARWLVKHDHARPHDYGGVSIWIGGYGQSMEKKEAHASAMAAYLCRVGIKAHAQSRMD